MCLFGLIVLATLVPTAAPARTTVVTRSARFVDRQFPLLMLCGIAAFFVSALNEKLYSTKSEAHSIYYGFFTLGGLVPVSDNHQYLSGVLNFLKFGELNGQANFRPLSHLFSSVIYRLSGDDWIRFFQVSTLLVTFSVWYHGLVVARHLGRFAALASVFILCVYYSLFQGMFLTELPGGVVGTFGLSVLMHGFFVRSLRAYVVGMVLTAIAMHMRTGVIFLLPALVLVGGTRFRSYFRTQVLAYLTMILVLASASLAPLLQYRLFREQVKSATNVGEYALKISKNSDKWPFSKVYPHKVVNGRMEGFDERMSRANMEIIRNVVRDLPAFTANYFSMMFRYLKKPERFLTPFTERLTVLTSLILLLLFASGWYLFSNDSDQRMLIRLLAIYLFCSVLAIPFLDFVKERNYAATVSFNTLFVAVAAQNAFLWFLRFTKTRFGEGFLASLARSFSHEALRPSSGKPGPRWIHPFPIVLAVGVLVGPLVLDRLRETGNLPGGYVSRWGDVPGTKVSVIPMEGTPSVLLDAEKDFPVIRPDELPKGKWYDDFKWSDMPEGRMHWIPASDMSVYGHDRMTSRNLLLPDSLLNGMDLSRVDTLVVRMDTARYGKLPFEYSRATEVLHVATRKGG